MPVARWCCIRTDPRAQARAPVPPTSPQPGQHVLHAASKDLAQQPIQRARLVLARQEAPGVQRFGDGRAHDVALAQAGAVHDPRPALVDQRQSKLDKRCQLPCGHGAGLRVLGPASAADDEADAGDAVAAHDLAQTSAELHHATAAGDAQQVAQRRVGRRIGDTHTGNSARRAAAVPMLSWCCTSTSDGARKWRTSTRG